MFKEYELYGEVEVQILRMTNREHQVRERGYRPGNTDKKTAVSIPK